MDIKRYLETLDREIEALITEEAEDMTDCGEQLLHVLLENRKHADMWARTQRLAG